MSYSSYNVRGISCKSDTIAYTSNHKFLPLESQVYLKRNNCRQEYDHHKIHEHTRDHPHNSKHEHTRDHDNTHNSKHEHTRDHDNTHNSKHEHTRDHNHPHQMCTKC